MTKEQLQHIMLECFHKGQNHGCTYVAECASERYMQEWLEFNDYMEEELSKLEIEE